MSTNQSNTTANQQAAVIKRDSKPLLESIIATLDKSGIPLSQSQIKIMAQTATVQTTVAMVSYEIDKNLARKTKELKATTLYKDIMNLKTKKRAAGKAHTGLSEELNGIFSLALADFMEGEDLQTKLEVINSSRQLPRGAKR
jgi:hypothetical protein